MSFAVAADAYDRFMGRYSQPLAPAFADFAGVRAGLSILDVGCGPGALTSEIVRRTSGSPIAAVDPSESFVDAARTRCPTVDVRLASAEELPFADESFDASLSQLVIHFMRDPIGGLREMARVTRSAGTVAVCTWDAERGATAPLWDAAPEAEGEAALPGMREGSLAALFEGAGLVPDTVASLLVNVEHPSFEDWWEPFTLGVGRAGSYVAGLSAGAREELRERCRTSLPDPPFTIAAQAWAVRARV